MIPIFIAIAVLAALSLGKKSGPPIATTYLDRNSATWDIVPIQIPNQPPSWNAISTSYLGTDQPVLVSRSKEDLARQIEIFALSHRRIA